MEKLLIPLHENDVAPRFDLATDVLIVDVSRDESAGARTEEKVVVLAQASAEEICRLVMSERAQTVICSGIEEEYRQFLVWKGVSVVDGVVGPVDRVVEAHAQSRLEPGAILYAD